VHKICGIGRLAGQAVSNSSHPMFLDSLRTAALKAVASHRTPKPECTSAQKRPQKAQNSLSVSSVAGFRPLTYPAYLVSGAAGSSCGASPIYCSIPWAARRPAPIARITVADPVTMSPPANTPGTEDMPVFSSISI